MTKHDRHDELVALLTEIRDRLPERTEVKVAPFDPNLIARNLDAIKHETETPMREHGECCEPALAGDLPGEPVEPGDLRAGDKVAFTWEGTGERITCNLLRERGLGRTVLLRSDTPVPGDSHPPVVVCREWACGISDVRLIERAPREDEEPDEALAKVICDADLTDYAGWDELNGLGMDSYRRMARAAREHIEAEQEEVVATLREEVAIQTARAERAEVERAEFNGFWKEALADVRKARGERDALRERYEALRADVKGTSQWPDFGAHAGVLRNLLDRDDERAAKWPAP